MARLKNGNKITRVLISLACLMVVVSPAIIYLYYITAFGFDIPFSDTWREIPFIKQYLTGKLQFLTLFTVYGPYKSVTDILTTLLIVKLFHWNTRIYSFIGFGYQVITGYILYKVYWQQSKQIRNQYIRILGCFPIFLCLFSLRQWEASFGQWSPVFFGGIFFPILAFYALDKMELRWFTIAVLSGIFGSLTFITGVLVWPIGLLQLLYVMKNKGPNESRKFILVPLVWGVFGVASSIIYLLGISAPSSSAKSLSNLMQIVQRFFITLGITLSADKGVISLQPKWTDATVDVRVSIIVGVFILLVLIVGSVLSWKKNANVFGLKLAIILFGLISVGMTAIGRTELGLQQAIASRYTAYSSIVVVGAYLVIVEASLLGKEYSHWAGLAAKELLRAIIVIILFSSVVATVTELYLGPYRKEFFMNWANTVRNYSSVSDDKFSVDPMISSGLTPQDLREYSHFLEEYQLSLFRK